MRRVYLTGKRFGRLVVVSDPIVWDMKVWAKCDCGKEKFVNRYSLVYGDTQSCGCLSFYNKMKRDKKKLALILDNLFTEDEVGADD